MYLFIDTTKDITVGILNQDLSWQSYEYLAGAKGSAQIHDHIFNTCEKFGHKIKDFKGVIQVAGPGSYTGMRVSDGVSQIFDWQGFETYSFYHFDVPTLLGKHKGTWVGNAFKGEVFLYQWDDNKTEKTLMSSDDFLNIDKNGFYTSFVDEKLEGNFIYTSELIKKNSKEIFTEIFNNETKKDLFYYRSIEQEYTRKNL